MPHRLKFTIPYGDAGDDGRLRIDALVNCLQWAAIHHAESVGQGSERLREQAAVWMLYRLSASWRERPAYGREIEIDTWPVGLSTARATREFELRCEGAVFARAASTWVFVDLVRRSPRRLPSEVAAAFPTEPGRGGFDRPPHEAPHPELPAEAVAESLSLRPSDFDTNGHLNNAACLDLALAALARRDSRRAPSGFAAMFMRELAWGATSVEVATAERDGAIVFALSADAVERVRGAFYF